MVKGGPFYATVSQLQEVNLLLKIIIYNKLLIEGMMNWWKKRENYILKPYNFWKVSINPFCPYFL